MGSVSWIPGALSLLVLLSACGTASSPMVTELPSAAANAPQCAGSSLALADVGLKPATAPPSVRAQGTVAPFGLIFATSSRADPTATSIAVVRADGSGLRMLVSGFFNADQPVVAPNRRSVAYQIDRGGLSGPELHVVNVDGTSDHMLYKADRYLTGVTWSPDSKTLAFLSDDHLKAVAARGGTTRIITDHGHSLPDVSSDHAAWSPHGDWIAFTDSSNVTGTLVIVHPDGSGRTDLASIYYSSDIAWAPNGSEIAFINRGISMVRPNGQGLRHLVAAPEGASIVGLSWSPDGQLIAYQGGPDSPDDPTVCVVGVVTPGLYHLGDCAAPQDAIAWLPNSRTVAFPQMDKQGCPRDSSWHLQFVDVSTLRGSGVAAPSPVYGDLSWVPLP